MGPPDWCGRRRGRHAVSIDSLAVVHGNSLLSGRPRRSGRRRGSSSMLGGGGAPHIDRVTEFSQGKSGSGGRRRGWRRGLGRGRRSGRPRIGRDEPMGVVVGRGDVSLTVFDQRQDHALRKRLPALTPTLGHGASSSSVRQAWPGAHRDPGPGADAGSADGLPERLRHREYRRRISRLPRVSTPASWPSDSKDATRARGPLLAA